MAKTNQKETNSNVQQAIDKIATDVHERLTPERKQRRIFGQTLQLLAKGYPVPPDDVAIRFQVPPDRVILHFEDLVQNLTKTATSWESG